MVKWIIVSLSVFFLMLIFGSRIKSYLLAIFNSNSNIKILAKELPCKVHIITVAKHRAFLFIPEKKPSNTHLPWLWFVPTTNESPRILHQWIFLQLLKNGIAIAGIDVGESYGNPESRVIFTKLYEALTSNYSLSKRVCFLAISRGGYMVYNWAIENPDRISCIAGIYPGCNLLASPDMNGVLKAYGMNELEFKKQSSKYNPIDNLSPLAKANIPILHIVGDNDRLSPIEKHSVLLSKRYKQLGGNIKLIIIPGKGHEEAPDFFQNREISDFIIKNTLNAYFQN